jgi:hypothetical protein
MTSDLLIVPPTLLAAGAAGAALAIPAVGTARTVAAIDAAPSTPGVRIRIPPARTAGAHGYLFP